MPGLPEALARPGLDLGWVWAGLWAGPRRPIFSGFEVDVRKSMKIHENPGNAIGRRYLADTPQIGRRIARVDMGGLNGLPQKCDF